MIVSATKSEASTVSMADAVRAETAKIAQGLPAGTTLEIVQDGGRNAENSLYNVTHALVFGAGLTVFVVYMFLNSWRSTLITALSLPTSVLASFIAVWLCGFSLNFMSLLGLSLAWPAAQAQGTPGASGAPSAPGAAANSGPADGRRQAANAAQIFYQVLLGEMSAASGDTGSAISLLLDAARKTQDEALFQRAADLALGSRAGDTALQVARSWRQLMPRSSIVFSSLARSVSRSSEMPRISKPWSWYCL